MGLLTEGSPLSWEDTKKKADFIRHHGIEQFISIYHKLRARYAKENHLFHFKWGDEIEGTLIKFDHVKKTAKLLLTASTLLKKLAEDEEFHEGAWHAEYGGYMIEGTPRQPYGCLVSHLETVEYSMKKRREEVAKLLDSDSESFITIGAFPRMGCPNFTHPSYTPDPVNSCSRSLFIPDEMISEHPRFKTLTRNIRQRRGEKVAINIPIFKDLRTPTPFTETFPSTDGEGGRNALPDHVYMDAMGFGMGLSCLQVTFQAWSLDEARNLYDHLTTLCPIMLALSAASPIYRGYLTESDCRWNVIAASVDDRTQEERGDKPLCEDRYRIPKSRYDSVNSYLSYDGAAFNDIDLVIDDRLKERLLNAGVDELLSNHIAHLFIRDPLVMFSHRVELDDAVDTDHFESIQSTNWQTMRFKPPPANSYNIGWRVEFRPMELQLTDFENAAFVVFTALLTRVILSYNLNFLIPISKVDENMRTSQKRDAVKKGMFFFRKDVRGPVNSHSMNYDFNNVMIKKCNGVIPPDGDGAHIRDDHLSPDESYELMSVDTIVNGKPGVFPGVLHYMMKYIHSLSLDGQACCTIHQYLQLISKRASGNLMTTAAWMRDFVTTHPSYRQDSVVSEEITYDLLMTCDNVTHGRCQDKRLSFRPRTCSRPRLCPIFKTKCDLSDK